MPIEIKVVRTAAGIRNAHTRMPFRFGVITMTAAPLLTLAVEIEAGGRRATGHAADFLAFRWFDKRPERSLADNCADLLRTVEVARALYLEAGRDGFAAPFELWRATHGEIERIALEEGFNRLGAAFGSSMLERAVIDARRAPQRAHVVRAGAGRPARHRARRHLEGAARPAHARVPARAAARARGRAAHRRPGRSDHRRRCRATRSPTACPRPSRTIWIATASAISRSRLQARSRRTSQRLERIAARARSPRAALPRLAGRQRAVPGAGRLSRPDRADQGRAEAAPALRSDHVHRAAARSGGDAGPGREPMLRALRQARDHRRGGRLRGRVPGGGARSATAASRTRTARASTSRCTTWR